MSKSRYEMVLVPEIGGHDGDGDGDGVERCPVYSMNKDIVCAS